MVRVSPQKSYMESNIDAYIQKSTRSYTFLLQEDINSYKYIMMIFISVHYTMGGRARVIGWLYFNRRGLIFVEHWLHDIHTSTLVLWSGFSHSFTKKHTWKQHRCRNQHKCIHKNQHTQIYAYMQPYTRNQPNICLRITLKLECEHTLRTVKCVNAPLFNNN